MLKSSDKSIDSLIRGRKNNFDFIRAIAAILVIFSHSYPLSLGGSAYDPLMNITKGKMTFGFLGVAIFFMLSGFLVSQSYIRHSNIGGFLKARLLRIIPALAVVVTITAIIIGPIVTTLSIKEYYLSEQVYEYFLNISLYKVEYFLPGVFEKNSYPSAVNGSLWTIPLEFKCYLIVGLLGTVGILKKKYLTSSLLIMTIVISFFKNSFFLLYFKFFATGMLYYFLREHVMIKGYIAVFSCGALLMSIISGVFLEGSLLIFGGYFLFYIAFSSRIEFHSFGKYGDFSYGLYLFAFPIQQIIVHYFGGQMNQVENFLMAFPITLGFSILSWHLIEKRILKFKEVRKADSLKAS